MWKKMGKLVWEFWDILGLIFIRHVSNFFCQKIASFKLWKKIICQKHSCLLYMCWKNIPSQTISLLIPRSTKKKKIYMTHNRKSKDYLFVKKQKWQANVSLLHIYTMTIWNEYYEIMNALEPRNTNCFMPILELWRRRLREFSNQ